MFTTYVYRDPISLVPIYVGMGTKDRPFIHWNVGAKNKLFENVLAKMKREGKKPIIEVIYFEQREDAATLEKDLIRWWGRRITGDGPLVNVLDGGDGGDTFSSQSPMQKELTVLRLAEAAKWARTDKHRQDISVRRKSQVTSTKYKESHEKQFVITNPDGLKISVTGLVKWCQENHMPHGSTGPILRGIPAKKGPWMGWCIERIK